MIPNLSTKNYKWILDPANNELLDDFGGIAFSVNSLKELEEATKVIKKFYGKDVEFHSYEPRVISVQHIVGTLPKKEFEDLLLRCIRLNVSITLLGMKEDNRGNAFKQKNKEIYEQMYKDGGFIESIKNCINFIEFYQKNITASSGKYYDICIGIDTLIAKRFQKELENVLKIDRRLFATEEGKFSCFIDAVNATIAPSSYSKKSKEKTIKLSLDSENLKDQMLEAYKTF